MGGGLTTKEYTGMKGVVIVIVGIVNGAMCCGNECWMGVGTLDVRWGLVSKCVVHGGICFRR